MNENMKIWNEVSSTNPAFTDKVSSSHGRFTAIDAYYQIQQATELWGPYGSTWGMKNMKRALVTEIEMAFLDVTFFYPGGEFEIGNSIDMKFRSSRNGDRWDDEFVKKLETNTISKALSRLGFGADVFVGKFDDPRYVDEQNEKFGNPKLEAPKPPGSIAPPGQIPAMPGVPPPPPPLRK